MAASASEILKYLWFIESRPKSGNKDQTLYSGALCINREGVLVTVTHGIKPECSAFENFPTLKGHTSVGPDRNLDWIEDTKYQTFGMTLLKIQKLQPDEVFDFFPIPEDDQSLDVGTGIHAFVHGDGVPFSFLRGRVCYPFRGILEIPENEFHPFTLRSTPPHLETRTISLVATEDNLGILGDDDQEVCVSCQPELVEMIGSGVLTSMDLVNPSIPLIQVTGFVNTTMDGQCGCPVFTEHNQLIGLIMFSTGNHQFLLPAKIVGYMVKSNRKIIRHATGKTSMKSKSVESSKRGRR